MKKKSGKKANDWKWVSKKNNNNKKQWCITGMTMHKIQFIYFLVDSTERDAYLLLVTWRRIFFRVNKMGLFWLYREKKNRFYAYVCHLIRYWFFMDFWIVVKQWRYDVETVKSQFEIEKTRFCFFRVIYRLNLINIVFFLCWLRKCENIFFLQWNKYRLIIEIGALF